MSLEKNSVDPIYSIIYLLEKKLFSRKFWGKMHGDSSDNKILYFPQHIVEITQNYSHVNFFRQTIFVIVLLNLLRKMKLFYTMYESSLIT